MDSPQLTSDRTELRPDITGSTTPRFRRPVSPTTGSLHPNSAHLIPLTSTLKRSASSTSFKAFPNVGSEDDFVNLGTTFVQDSENAEYISPSLELPDAGAEKHIETHGSSIHDQVHVNSNNRKFGHHHHEHTSENDHEHNHEPGNHHIGCVSEQHHELEKEHNHKSYRHHNHEHDTFISKPLPSISHIFSNLHSSQKTLFTWACVHLILGIALWLKGQRGDRLALLGFGYLVIFDALGVFAKFISAVILTYRSLQVSTLRHPFGVQRYEVLFGFMSIIYLLFVAMYTMKESLEHLMLETSQEHYDEGSSAFPFFLVLSSIGATLISSMFYQNHQDFCEVLRKNSYSNYQPKNDILSSVFSNYFTMLTLGCGISVVAAGLIAEKNPTLGWLDVILSLLESILMFLIAKPVATLLGKILLQTTPDTISPNLEACLREIQHDPSILRIIAVHVWQNSYNQLVGTLCIHVRPDANEQVVLTHVYQRLGPLLHIGNANVHDGGCLAAGGGGELTVQIPMNMKWISIIMNDDFNIQSAYYSISGLKKFQTNLNNIQRDT
ncbi:863_t:CDS:10, partial [Ambispora leptoticha]